MKIFLDASHEALSGWTQVHTVPEAINLLRSGEVEEISLAFDLGDDEGGNGQTLILWIEQAVMAGGFRPPIITIHSARSTVRKKMEETIRAIHLMATAQNAR